MDLSPPPRGAVRAAKTVLRDQVLAGRRRLPLEDLGALGGQLADRLLAHEEVRRAATVTAYVSVGREPGTSRLIDGLRAAGKRVILPVVLPDLDLDWAVYEGDASLASSTYGLLEPTGPRLGTEAVATADAVLVPGLAVSDQGYRLGRGARWVRRDPPRRRRAARR